jgi:hypothetical protein
MNDLDQVFPPSRRHENLHSMKLVILRWNESRLIGDLEIEANFPLAWRQKLNKSKLRLRGTEKTYR